MSGFQRLLEEVRARVREVDVAGLRAELASAAPPLLVDVREADELEAGLLPGAHHVPRGFLELRAEALWPTSARLVVYCAAGTRSALAADTLVQLGFEDVRSLAGGVSAWRREGGTFAPAPKLTAAQAQRYSRHVLLSEVGVAGQAKLCASKVLLVGLGPSGSSAAAYLAAAGVGTLSLCDPAPQPGIGGELGLLHETAFNGDRAHSAAVTLRAQNPDVRVEVLSETTPRGLAALGASHDLLFLADAAFDVDEQERLVREAGCASVLVRCAPHEQGYVLARARQTAAPCAHACHAALAEVSGGTGEAAAGSDANPPVAAALLGALGASQAIVALLGLAAAPASWTQHDESAGTFRDMLAASGQGVAPCARCGTEQPGGVH